MLSRPSLCWCAIILAAFFNTVHAQDSVFSGTFEILFCNAGTPNSDAAYLQALLCHVLKGLQKTITDVQLSTASIHGFTAFFKTNNDRAIVQNVFQTIISAPKLGLDETDPVFACTDPSQDLTAKLYADCLQ
ncbi:hypothetical protein MMC08_005039 [Hypocenomyce scalaris]|nr:hypothetical protein [Hypocenomyce scalaris]